MKTDHAPVYHRPCQCESKLDFRFKVWQDQWRTRDFSE